MQPKNKKFLDQAHIFALYYPAFHMQQEGETLVINDAPLVHRIKRVLRLAEQDSCILFDQKLNMLIRIDSMDQRAIYSTILKIEKNKVFKPNITFFLPVLKRDALNAAIYSLVEAGVNTIQLLLTDKMHRGFRMEKELKRLERIVIAAAEQSKNFAFAQLLEPISVEQAVSKLRGQLCFVGDPAGQVVSDLICNMQAPEKIALFVGPEGDFSTREKKLLSDASCKKIKLTPTILRAESAAFYLASLFRSVFFK